MSCRVDKRPRDDFEGFEPEMRTHHHRDESRRFDLCAHGGGSASRNGGCDTSSNFDTWDVLNSANVDRMLRMSERQLRVKELEMLRKLSKFE